jgi:NitT/TauT family transport system substrate-binding protein
MAGQPKPAFYGAVFVVVAALIGFAVYNADFFAPDGNPDGGGEQAGDIDPKKLGLGGGAESHDTNAVGVTTVKEYSFTPSERLPPVKGTAAFKPMKDNTVRFALNVWAGWAPIIYANDGFKPKKVWKTPDGKEFKVELVMMDEPVAMRDAYAGGDVHIGWATLDMMPLIMEGFVEKNGKPKDSRVMPRIYQQIDWSNGGDGIVVRGKVKTVADLRGKKIVLAQNSPSHYFILNMLVAGGVQPSEVKFVYTDDAFKAAAAFNSEKDISAVVTWAPDIYNLEKVKGNKLLVTTGTANKLIADVWFARADFAEKHPDIIEGLVRGIFDGMQDLKTQKAKQQCAELMAVDFGLPASEAMEMFADAHSTNWGENFEFFMNQNNTANFERTWNTAYYLYRRIGSVTHRRVPFDQVMDFSIIAKLGKEAAYKSQVDEYTKPFTPKPVQAIRVEEDEILTNTVVIHFSPNSSNLRETIIRNENGKKVEVLYDPNIDFVIEEIGKLAGQFGKARIIIEGHTDSSMRSKLPDDKMVKQLSRERADAIKAALVKKFSNLDANRFSVAGMGWDRPADKDDEYNHAKNRRVEIKIFTAEKD